MVLQLLSCIFNMVYTCYVPHCKTGYRSHKADKKIQLFKFPKDVVLHRKWISAIPRQGWTVNNSHRVCANHFYENDFQTTTTNCRKVKKSTGAEGKGKLARIRLKPTAVPSVFSGLPQYLTTKPFIERNTSSSTSARQNRENSRLEELNNEFLSGDVIDNFEHLRLNLNKLTVPSGYIISNETNCIRFYYVECEEDVSVPPRLCASLKG